MVAYVLITLLFVHGLDYSPALKTLNGTYPKVRLSSAGWPLMSSISS